MIKVILEIDEENSTLELGRFESYFRCDMGLYILQNEKKILLFATNMYSTFLNELNDILVEMYSNSNKTDEIDSFDGAYSYLIKRAKEIMKVTTVIRVTEEIENQYEFNFFEFLKGYIITLEKHLFFLQNTNNEIRKNEKFNLLLNELIELKQLDL